MKRMIDADELIDYIRTNGLLSADYSDTEREDDVVDMIELRAGLSIHHWRNRKFETKCSERHARLFGWYECSNCTYKGNPKWEYCPGCGSPMDGVLKERDG